MFPPPVFEMIQEVWSSAFCNRSGPVRLPWPSCDPISNLWPHFLTRLFSFHPFPLSIFYLSTIRFVSTSVTVWCDHILICKNRKCMKSVVFSLEDVLLHPVSTFSIWIAFCQNPSVFRFYSFHWNLFKLSWKPNITLIFNFSFLGYLFKDKNENKKVGWKSYVFEWDDLHISKLQICGKTSYLNLKLQ